LAVGVTAGAILSELAARSEFNPPKYRRYWSDDPAVPLAVPSALRSFLGQARRPQLSDRTIPLFEFRSPSEYYPTNPSQPSELDRLLSWASRSLQHMLGSKVHFTRACLTRYVPPAGFGYPLDGLLPSSPRRLYFTPTALLGFTLRSFPLPQGIRHVSVRKHPLTVFPAVATVASDGPARQAAVPGL
jgi:hypothetical protein